MESARLPPAERCAGDCGEPDRLVCHECVGDYALRRFIRQNGARGRCDYCGRSRNSIRLGALMEPVMDGIRSQYSDAPKTHEDPGVGSLPTYDGYDLICDELAGELDIPNPDLLRDIARLMDSQTIWYVNSFFEGSEDEDAYYSWELFSRLVKEEARYVFYSLPAEQDRPVGSSPVQILDVIRGYVDLLRLVHPVSPESHKIYRGRAHGPETSFTAVEEFCPPDRLRAKANRMSPEGIPMFYGAYEKETVLAEIYSAEQECATVAEFSLQRPIQVLDLTIPFRRALPSLFDKEKRAQRYPLLFLRRFAEAISKPTRGQDGIEYVPSQVVTEFFKHVYRTRDGIKLDGIVYKSAKRENGRCIVLFIGKEGCAERHENPENKPAKDAPFRPPLLRMNPKKLVRVRKEWYTVSG